MRVKKGEVGREVRASARGVLADSRGYKKLV